MELVNGVRKIKDKKKGSRWKVEDRGIGVCEWREDEEGQEEEKK